MADLVIVPTRPSPHDLRAVGATVEMSERHRQAADLRRQRRDAARPHHRRGGRRAVAARHGGADHLSSPHRFRRQHDRRPHRDGAARRRALRRRDRGIVAACCRSARTGRAGASFGRGPAMRRIEAAASLRTLGGSPPEDSAARVAPAAKEGNVTRFFAEPPAPQAALSGRRPASSAALEPPPAHRMSSRSGIWHVPVLHKARGLAAQLLRRREAPEPDAANPRFEQFRKRRFGSDPAV